jgi:predicted dehydrogenase
MKAPLDRRDFLKASAAAGAVLSGWHVAEAQVSAQDDKPIRVGVMGVNGRGGSLINSFIGQKAEIAYVCDVDKRALERATANVTARQSKEPKGVEDFRRILDDKSVDALVVATPNHWHAPAAIIACKAGKHVYVEKPCSHNPWEGELAVAAARNNNRVVQMGSQRRSYPSIVEAIEKLHAGKIGRTLYARTWYNNRRPSIGYGKEVAPPDWLNWSLWQGPAAERPFKDNLVHYNWHWHWHWGNGELGNNGIHALDVARWGMDVKFPSRVVSAGGKYRHDDDQETPDTNMVTFDFPEGKTITWEGLSWSPYGPGGTGFGITFHGDKGTMYVDGSGYKIFDMMRKEIHNTPGKGGDSYHIDNFLHCIRTGDRPNADIELGHQSTLLCHLGNIAYRVNRVLTIDEKNGHIVDDKEAMGLWKREYNPAWEKDVTG